MLETPNIPGAEDVVAWFGHWPMFHDAEVLTITLDRTGTSRVVIHAFEMTKHAVVTFLLDGFPPDQYGVTNTRLDFFNGQNVLSSAYIKPIPEGFELVLEGVHGLDGSIFCERPSVALKPGETLKRAPHR
jgi:hypothetical protein